MDEDPIILADLRYREMLSLTALGRQTLAEFARHADPTKYLPHTPNRGKYKNQTIYRNPITRAWMEKLPDGYEEQEGKVVKSQASSGTDAAPSPVPTAIKDDYSGQVDKAYSHYQTIADNLRNLTVDEMRGQFSQLSGLPKKVLGGVLARLGYPPRGTKEEMEGRLLGNLLTLKISYDQTAQIGQPPKQAGGQKVSAPASATSVADKGSTASAQAAKPNFAERLVNLNTLIDASTHADLSHEDLEKAVRHQFRDASDQEARDLAHQMGYHRASTGKEAENQVVQRVHDRKAMWDQVRSGGDASGKMYPHAPHVLAALPRAKQLVQEAVGKVSVGQPQQPPSRPFKITNDQEYGPLPEHLKNLKLTPLQQDMVDVADDWLRQKPGDIPFDELYKTLQTRHQDLTPEQFKSALRFLHDQDRLRMGGWPASPDKLPRPELGVRVGSSEYEHENKLMWYLHGGSGVARAGYYTKQPTAALAVETARPPKQVATRHFGQFLPELGPATGHINGQPTNRSVTVHFWQKKDGFYWTLDAGNARHKNLRGPYDNLDVAQMAVKKDLNLI